MNNYGYRGITTNVPAIAGVIQRGSVARGQRKGQTFAITSPANIIINRVNGREDSITVLHNDGTAMARLYSGSAIY